MNRQQLENAIRNEVLETIIDALKNKFDTDVLYTANNEIMMPALDPENNERFAVVKVTVPRGKRNSETGTYDGYDGYAAADEYKWDMEQKAEEKRIKEENKRREKENKERKQKAKKIVKKLNETGLDGMIHEEEG